MKMKIAIIIILLIVDAILLNTIIGCFSSHYNGDIDGKLIYINNASAPNDPNTGIYLEVNLTTPDNIPWGKAIIYIVTDNTMYDGIFINKKSGNHDYDNIITVDIDDKDGSAGISTGDLIHIYGANLTNSSVYFHGMAYKGSISVNIQNIIDLIFKSFSLSYGRETSFFICLR